MVFVLPILTALASVGVMAANTAAAVTTAAVSSIPVVGTSIAAGTKALGGAVGSSVASAAAAKGIASAGAIGSLTSGTITTAGNLAVLGAVVPTGFVETATRGSIYGSFTKTTRSPFWDMVIGDERIVSTTHTENRKLFRWLDKLKTEGDIDTARPRVNTSYPNKPERNRVLFKWLYYPYN